MESDLPYAQNLAREADVGISHKGPVCSKAAADIKATAMSQLMIQITMVTCRW